MLRLSLILCTYGVLQISSSAIPVWELLSKEEKMSYLYSMFANQVEEVCEFSENKYCNQELLKYGLKKLKSMSEEHLDNMDPYQRGANHIIWGSMMEGHSMMRTTPKVRTTTTPKPNSYNDDLFFRIEDLGNQGAASAKIDSVYRVAPPKGFVYNRPTLNTLRYSSIRSGTPEYTQPQNGGRYQNRLPLDDVLSSSTSAPPNRLLVKVPLTGPMVVRVYPDGRPVDGPPQLPQDEDLRQYKMSQMRLPTF